jgi:hypothetical protein
LLLLFSAAVVVDVVVVPLTHTHEPVIRWNVFVRKDRPLFSDLLPHTDDAAAGSVRAPPTGADSRTGSAEKRVNCESDDTSRRITSWKAAKPFHSCSQFQGNKMTMESNLSGHQHQKKRSETGNKRMTDHQVLFYLPSENKCSSHSLTTGG